MLRTRPRPPPPVRDADFSEYASGHTLMRAPSDELTMVMLRTRMSSTWSMRVGYWPSEPTEMPWVPLQWRFWTRMDVLLGLNDTQSDWNVSCVC